MNVLITSGNISEFVDDATYMQSVTCTRIGAAIAEEFSKYTKINHIFFLHTPNASVPFRASNGHDVKFSLDKWVEKIAVQEVGNVEELENHLRELMQQYKFDLVIHLMSIPNYTTSQLHFLDSPADALGLMQRIADEYSIPFQLSDELSGVMSIIESGHKECVIRQIKRHKIMKIFPLLNPDVCVVSSKIRNYNNPERLQQDMKDSFEKNQSSRVIGIDMLQNKLSYKDICYLYDGDTLQSFQTYQSFSESFVPLFIEGETN